ncbi:DNA-repair protein XRCC1 isoform X2 [Quercus robur]|uniref:DNA-repair protein XRCC1 isoform X2 n=1 Tax=Quercus robur TaxID=38942 RepID=UPI002163F27E|nr:DNA-repair protein XRCC1 isoform X2 [Quercus robur]
MSDTKKSLGSGGNKGGKRNLPSWMSSRENDCKSGGNGDSEAEESNEGEKPKEVKGRGKGGLSQCETLLCGQEGVVFVLSGFINPERSNLRSQALEMGAEYQPDWNPDCTLLVCAFPNTPKFRQVEADCGTIVSKEWISDCYAQKKLVDIESFLMHAGKPWRRSNISNQSQDKIVSPPGKSEKQVERGSHSKPTAPTSSECRASNTTKECFSPSKVKRWAVDDLSKTITWLESQDEKPEPSEISKIAAEGILTCLQDAIDSLEQKQDIQQATEQWNFVPRVVEELAKLEGTGNDLASNSKEDLCKQAKACKRIYEQELKNLDDNPSTKKKKPKTDEKNLRTNGKNKDVTGYDSDETMEMTEEEIDIAFKAVASKISQ